MTREFMQATFKVNMNNAEYVYILPWLQSGTKDSSPWVGASGEMLQQVKDHYANAIIIDDVNGFDDTIVENFMKRVEKYGMSRADIDVTNIYGYINLFDALKLYAVAARKAYETSKHNITYIKNGNIIWNNMRRTSFEGVGTTGGSLGTVIMDDLADRVPLFAAFYISPTRDTVLK
uniref:Receptor ligand binding region domain-containing protein n=1 Tax=Acrobeloides nanus TaxID=290746 RepID=A0A914D2S4_9BILA